jgi:hypothetical protein
MDENEPTALTADVCIVPKVFGSTCSQPDHAGSHESPWRFVGYCRIDRFGHSGQLPDDGAFGSFR